MNIAIWVLQAVLALLFLAAGAMKASKSREELAESMGWVEDFSEKSIRSIGLVEILAAFGLLLPSMSGILPVLTPLAATGLAITMVLAIGVHLRRREFPAIAVNLILLAMSAVVAWGRFGPYSFF